ncbi:hypothetical protein RHSIM_Rhsim01G0031500 [Rhododendron simsii]|uniref:F-box domain-containing protein n=1 Tax=Rhododendron simsii TaxID=118357 RepID=A0A834HKZ5_RHOSS|nr:hypothetical protein RHSIM_Rhsim01G0031500 [Rhododendron simsii]
MKKQAHGHFPDDLWELIFQKLREDDERDLGSISLVSKRFLLISNRAKLSLNINNGTLPQLPNLLRRFLHIRTIVIDTNAHKDMDGLLDQISRSGALNLQAIKFVLDCSRLILVQDSDLVLIADLFPRLEELKIWAYKKITNDDVTAGITDNGVDALASKLKGLKEFVLTAEVVEAMGFRGAVERVSDVLRRSSDNSVVNLKTLNARGTHVNDEGLAMIGNRCQNLQYLDIGLCKEVTDKGVMEVVTN